MQRRVSPFVTAGEALPAHVTGLTHHEEAKTMDTPPKARRGFACMNPERRREIARKGGAAVDAKHRSFWKDRDLAASAGRKGGEASRGGGRKPAVA